MEIFKIDRSNGQSSPSSPKARDGQRIRGLELQITKGVKWMERNVERGDTRVKERRGRWQVVKSERFFTVLPRGGVKGSYRVGPVRPVLHTGQTGRT